jgi:hypothetical protein
METRSDRRRRINAWTHPLAGNLSRRTAVGRLAGAGLAASLAIHAGRFPVLGQATPEAEEDDGQAPNAFTLAGDGTRIGYGTTSITGEPVFSYEGPFGNRSFAGDEIGSEASPTLGEVVSVLLAEEPDARVVWLALLLPPFNPMRLGDEPIPFETLAIVTSHLTTMEGPGQIDGALQTYEVGALVGTAQFVIS